MKRIKKYLVLFLIVFSLWLTASFLDVNAHNMDEQSYAAWNLVSVFVQMCTGGDAEAKGKSITVHLINLKRSGEPQKPSAAPQATQVPSAKGVTNKKIYRLAQLMYAENGSAANDDCVFLTGIVVLKRMKSDKYPNTLEGVISQEGQYSTYQTGKIECKPDERCLEIAEEILRFNLQKYYPDNLVYQAEFPQGSKIYEQFGQEYFCLD